MDICDRSCSFMCVSRTGVVMVATSIGKKFHHVPPRSETSSQQCKISVADNATGGGGGRHRILVAWGRHEVNLWQACPGYLVLLES